MTNKQAIEMLSEIRCGYNCFDEADRRFYEALSVAIEALSCSEKPNRSDAIYRQDAIDVVKGIDSYFVKYIEELPSAQPEQECEKCIFKPFKQFSQNNGRKNDGPIH